MTTSTTLDHVLLVSKRSGHLRMLFRDNGIPLGILHVRDSLLQPYSVRAEEIMRPIFTLPADTAVHIALASMRESRNHLAVVTDEGTTIGVISLADVLARLSRPERLI